MRAVVADFFFNCWCFEIPSDNHIQHVPSGPIIMHQTFDQKYLNIYIKNFRVGSGSRTPELYSRLVPVLFYLW
jgi:hypothetical protein